MPMRRNDYDPNQCGYLRTSSPSKVRTDICYVRNEVEVFGNGVESEFAVYAYYFEASPAGMELINSKPFQSGQMSWRAQPRSRGAGLSRVSISQDKLSDSRYDDDGNLLVTFRSMDCRSRVEIKIYLLGEDSCAFVGMPNGFSRLDLIIGS